MVPFGLNSYRFCIADFGFTQVFEDLQNFNIRIKDVKGFSKHFSAPELRRSEDSEDENRLVDPIKAQIYSLAATVIRLY